MATLTMDDDVLIEVDEHAKEEEISREDFIKRAIRLYLHQKMMADLHEHARRMGITPEVIAEEIRQYRAEQRQSDE